MRISLTGGDRAGVSACTPSDITRIRGLVLRFGLMTYYQAVSGYKPADRGALPDYPVVYTIDDLLAGKDKEMELALSLARGE